MIGKNFIAYWEESEGSVVLGNKCNLLKKNSWGFEVVAAMQPPKKLKFLPSFELGNSVSIILPATKLLHNEYWLHYSAHILCLKDNPPNRTKYGSKGTSKSANFPPV